VALTTDQARAVVLIKGDNSEGTGFLVKTADGPTVVTNLHVISDNPNLKITTNTGQQITVLSLKGASDRDLAMFAIKDQNYSYLPSPPTSAASRSRATKSSPPATARGAK
jgi:S1-C subfamily serine protease